MAYGNYHRTEINQTVKLLKMNEREKTFVWKKYLIIIRAVRVCVRSGERVWRETIDRTN